MKMSEFIIKNGEINPFANNPYAQETTQQVTVFRHGNEYTHLTYSKSVSALSRLAKLIKAFALTVFTAFLGPCFSKTLKELWFQGFSGKQSIDVLIQKPTVERTCLNLPSHVPLVVQNKIFGINGVLGVDRENGNMLPYSSLETANIGETNKTALGYSFDKLKRDPNYLPFSLIAARMTDNKDEIPQIFVHVPGNSRTSNDYPGLLGRGCFGNTEIAQNLSTREWVAVKCYKHKEPEKQLPQDLLDKEIEVLKIMGMYRGYSAYSGKKNVYMQLVDGCDLLQINPEQLPSQLSDQIESALSAITELKKLHNRNYIHGDIHRGNLILNTRDNTIKLIDFNKSTPLSSEGTAMNVPGAYWINLPGDILAEGYNKGYMVLSKYTDRFALGTTLAYMFSQKKHPIKRSDGSIEQLLHKPPGLLCADEDWIELEQCLRLLTDDEGSDLTKAEQGLRLLLEKLKDDRCFKPS